MPVTDHLFRAATIDGQLRPLLQVKYINPHTDQHLSAWALIDTGADTCVLPDMFAELLGHNLERGEKTEIVGASGNGIAYKHTMKIEIPGFCTEETLVSFVPNLRQPLLGVENFLSNFCLTIDYPKQRFSMKFSDAADPNENPHSWGRHKTLQPIP